MSTVTPTEIDVSAYPWSTIGIEARVPIEIELPEEVAAAVQERFEEASERGDPDFADFICDVIVFEPTYVVDGVEIDEDTGRPVEDNE